MDNTALFGRGRTVILGALLLCPALAGCSDSDKLKKQISGLEAQLTAMRADQDRMEERVAAMELSASVPRTAPVAAEPDDRVERPRLKVIHLAPEDEARPATGPARPASPGDEGAAGRRPVIRGTGDRVIKVGDAEGDADESARQAATKPVAQLGQEARGN